MSAIKAILAIAGLALAADTHQNRVGLFTLLALRQDLGFKGLGYLSMQAKSLDLCLLVGELAGITGVAEDRAVLKIGIRIGCRCSLKLALVLATILQLLVTRCTLSLTAMVALVFAALLVLVLTAFQQNRIRFLARSPRCALARSRCLQQCLL